MRVELTRAELDTLERWQVMLLGALRRGDLGAADHYQRHIRSFAEARGIRLEKRDGR
jgi:hypothetical protein